MWERYCRGVNAIVCVLVHVQRLPVLTRCTRARRSFVVDAADHSTLETARNELHNLLKPQEGKENPLAGIPLLVLGNKKDLPGALSERELIERMDLQALAQARALAPRLGGISPHHSARLARSAPTACLARTW